MWFFGGAGNKANDEPRVSQSPKQRGVVDMTSLDITYITHRLLGELEYSIYGTLRLVSASYLVLEEIENHLQCRCLGILGQGQREAFQSRSQGD